MAPMLTLRRWIRVWVLTGLCVGLFACLGGITAAETVEASSSTADVSPREIRRVTAIDRAPTSDECECCTSRCSMAVDRARSSVDIADMWTVWMLLGAAAASLLAYAVIRQALPTARDRSRWWCRPTLASLCVIVR